MKSTTCFSFSRLLAAALLAWVWTGCSSSSNGEEVTFDFSATPAATEVPSTEGLVPVTLTGTKGLAWKAEIVAGSDWVSFDRLAQVDTKSGTLLAPTDAVNLYVNANPTEAERSATVRWTVNGSAAGEFSLQQAAKPQASGDEQDGFPSEQVAVWPELPACQANDLYVYTTHYCDVQGKKGRNYTMCFDRTKHGAWWVAYPLHDAYLGTTKRSDEWMFDPSIDDAWQANLTLGSYVNGDQWNRGHQIPSADRTASREMNQQTFYCSNSTPQDAALNGNTWADLETATRNWRCQDTLYVVTGAWWDPAGKQSTPDKAGKTCPIPDYYFKVMVRTKKGNIRQAGDLLGNYAADQLQAIGFWAPNAANQGSMKTWAKSVAEIEALTGFTFFQTLPAAVKQQNAPADWGIK